MTDVFYGVPVPTCPSVSAGVSVCPRLLSLAAVGGAMISAVRAPKNPNHHHPSDGRVCPVSELADVDGSVRGTPSAGASALPGGSGARGGAGGGAGRAPAAGRPPLLAGPTAGRAG